MKFLWGLIPFLLAGCAMDRPNISGSPLGISETRRVVVSVIGEPRQISSNGRELLSMYYDEQGKFLAEPSKADERYLTHVLILGDRRPYDLVVKVILEVKEDGAFNAIEEEPDKAQAIADKIKARLYQERDERNLIDDFQAF